METADERLKALSELHEDWDDEGALPICPLVLQHTKSLIDAANDMDLAHWNLFPAINGTLTFLHENKDAMLSIGEDDFSFVFASEGNRQCTFFYCRNLGTNQNGEYKLNRPIKI